MPEGFSASEDTLFAFNECCAEFVNMVASEAIAVGGGQTVSYKNTVKAMKNLGLDTYMEQAESLVAQDIQEVQAARKRKARKNERTQEEEDAAAKRQRELLAATAESFRREQGL